MLASIKNTYHNNFLEYKLTGNTKYKNAADEALTSINKVISDLESKVYSTPLPIIQNKTNNTKNLIKEKDELVEAEMRTSKTSYIDWRYYLIAGLVVVSFFVK